MKTRQLALGLSVVALAMTGCAAGKDSAAVAPAGAATSMAGMSMAPGQSMAGMSMAPGQTMAGMSTTPSPLTAGTSTPDAKSQPSARSKMVCTGDVREEVQKVLKLSAPAPVSTSWQDQLFTCTYSLPMGKMVLSVKESATKAAAAGYFQALRTRSGNTTALQGVGEQGFATKTGIAVVLKDSFTLQVDTTALPETFGPQQQRRTDLAYEMATVVMGCWIEHS
jgi:hypothetical protein